MRPESNPLRDAFKTRLWRAVWSAPTRTMFLGRPATWQAEGAVLCGPGPFGTQTGCITAQYRGRGEGTRRQLVGASGERTDHRDGPSHGSSGHRKKGQLDP